MNKTPQPHQQRSTIFVEASKNLEFGIAEVRSSNLNDRTLYEDPASAPNESIIMTDT